MEGHTLLTAEYLGSIAGIVTLAIVLTNMTKRYLGNVPGLSQVPVFAFVAAWTAGLTWVAVNVVHSIEGDTASLIVQALLFALASSGLVEVKRAGLKPIEESRTAQRAALNAEINRRLCILLPLLLAGALTVSACGGLRIETPAPANPAPTEEQVQATRAKALQLAKAVESAAHLITEAGRATDAAYRAGLVPRSVADQVDTAIVAYAPRANALIDIAASVTTDPQLRTTVQALMAIVDDLLVKLASGNEAMRTLSVSIRTALTVASTYLSGGVQ